VQRTGEQRFFVVLTNYYVEHIKKLKTDDEILR